MIEGHHVDSNGIPIPLRRSDDLSLKVSFGPENYRLNLSPRIFQERHRDRFTGDVPNSTFVWAQGLNSKTVSAYWDRIELSEREDDVVRALQILVPQLVRVGLGKVDEGNSNRVARVRLSSQSEPIPMRSLGEGTNRLFALSLALVSSSGGLLLIDEVETGLHHSVQADMWKLIFETAKRLNIQVFATTHSYDCIRAFEEAASQDEETEGVLIRLENKGGKVVAVSFGEDKLSYAVREEIEVR